LELGFDEKEKRPLDEGWESIGEDTMRSILATLNVPIGDVCEDFSLLRTFLLRVALSVEFPNGYSVQYKPPESVAKEESKHSSRLGYLKQFSDEVSKALQFSSSNPPQRGDFRSALYHSICVDALVLTTQKVAEALWGAGADAEIGSDDNDEDESSPFTILDVKEDAKASEIFSAAGLPFSTGCAFYEVVKSESVSKGKLIVAFEKKNKKWYENEDARKLVGLPVGKDGKAAPKAGFRIFVQSTSPNRKIPAGSGLLYKGEVAQQRKQKQAKKSGKKKKKRGSDDEDDEMDLEENEQRNSGEDDDEGEDEDGEEDDEDGETESVALPDLTEYGQMKLLSFYGAPKALRSKVINFMNQCWFTDYFACPNLGPAMNYYEEQSFAITQLVRFGYNPSGSTLPISFFVGLNVEADGYTEFEHFTTQNEVIDYVYQYQYGLQLKGRMKCNLMTTSPHASVEPLGSLPSEIGMIASDLLKLFNAAKQQGEQRVFRGDARIDAAVRARGRDALKQLCRSIYGEKEAEKFIKSSFVDEFPFH
jgi:hypothetical protein